MNVQADALAFLFRLSPECLMRYLGCIRSGGRVPGDEAERKRKPEISAGPSVSTISDNASAGPEILLAYDGSNIKSPS